MESTQRFAGKPLKIIKRFGTPKPKNGRKILNIYSYRNKTYF
jgi:hypothetical protein